MTKLSFVIPNYNSGNLLKRCVMSIIASDNTHFEIIVVDDGSSDKSIDLIKGLDSRITIIKQFNQGVAVARNNGLKNVSGDYVAFIDADDTLCKGWDHYVFKDIDRKVDLVIFNYLNNNSKYRINDKDKLYKNDDANDIKLRAIKNPTKYMTVWGKLFNRFVISQYHLEFDKHLRLAEDGDFMIQYLTIAKTIYISQHYFYHYQINDKSVMHTFDLHKVDDYLKSLNITYHKIDNCQLLKSSYKYYILMHLNIMMVHEVFDIDNFNSYYQKIDQLKKIVKVPIINSALHDVKIKECNSPRMVPILLLKLRLYRLVGFVYKMRSYHNHNMTV